MKSAFDRARRLSLAALTVAALGFGTTQALAAPSADADARVCNPQACNRICQTIPGSIGGFCGSDGSCNCYI